MPRYYPIRRWTDAVARSRTIDRLLALRAQLAREVVAHRSAGSFFLATWNIRDFDSNKFGHGKRLPEAYHYIAEIISAFDLVAVQEVNRDLTGLNRLMQLLGQDWDCIMTDTTEGTSGNSERLAFLFDRRAVRFRHIAGEIVLPQGQEVVSRNKIKGKDGKSTTVERALQFARSPFVAAFQAGWFKFNLCTVHIYYGAASGDELQRRIEEIRQVARFLAERDKKEEGDTILLGDFNIVSPEHETMQALTAEGFVIPENLTREKSNLGGDKHYDQIALRVTEKRLEIGASGVFDFTKSVYRDEDFDAYFDAMPPAKRDFHFEGKKKGQRRTEAEQRAYYRDLWRTWQMSDHKLMWVELKCDFTDAYLASLKPGAQPL